MRNGSRQVISSDSQVHVGDVRLQDKDHAEDEDDDGSSDLARQLDELDKLSAMHQAKSSASSSTTSRRSNQSSRSSVILDPAPSSGSNMC